MSRTELIDKLHDEVSLLNDSELGILVDFMAAARSGDTVADIVEVAPLIAKLFEATQNCVALTVQVARKDAEITQLDSKVHDLCVELAKARADLHRASLIIKQDMKE